MKNGTVELRADVEKDTLWATQGQIARLFDVNPQAIIKHLKNIYKEGELRKSSTCSKMEQVQIELGRAVKRRIDFYNLDAISECGNQYFQPVKRYCQKLRVVATPDCRLMAAMVMYGMTIGLF